MAYGDTPYDKPLRDAWGEFCDDLKAAGSLIFRDRSPATSLDRAEGFRHLSRYITRAFLVNLEGNDPLCPFFWRNQEPTRKYGGDNPDALNMRAAIDGEHTYRVVGNRGSAHYVVFTILTGWDMPAQGSSQVGILLGSQLKTEWDGSFELVLSPQPHQGNWIKTVPGARWLAVRQFFADWEREAPMTVRIERVGADAPPPPLTPERVAAALREAGKFLGRESTYWADWQERYRAQPNVFLHSATAKAHGAAPGGLPLHTYWKVQPDEVLLIEVTPPRCLFWNLEMNNYWMASPDYRYHLSSINGKQAVLEEDGSVRIAVSHRDPGIPNWLDTGGHREGHIGLRWMQAESTPIPTTRLVKLTVLPSILPPNPRRINPDERREQLRRRKIGVDRRFRV